MATKTVKKAATKPVAAKKTTVKKTAVKKPVVATADVHNCPCGADCKCHDCKCHGGCKCGHIVKKVVIVLVIFALGFAAAKLCCCGRSGMGAPRVHFVNGCVDMASIKCPKMLEEMAQMDINNDGCISREEMRAAKKKGHHRPMPRKHPAPQHHEVAEPAPVDAE